MKLRNYNFTVGADPELFIYDLNGTPVCPHGLVPGTKARPAPMGDKGNSIQMDGMAAEFGVQPSDGMDIFVDRIESAKKELSALLGGDYVVKALSTCDFGLSLFDAPDVCLESGCDPDFEAYTNQRDADGSVVEPPLPKANEMGNVGNVTFRTGGGHVHVGWTEKSVDPFHPDHLEGCRMLTTAMDLFLGVPSTLFDPDKERRRLYGKAGAFRPKSYGMEYRSLSNFWVDDPDLTRWVFASTMAAVDVLFRKKKRLVRQAKNECRPFINETKSAQETIEFVRKLYADNKDSEQVPEAEKYFWRCLDV